MVAASCGHTHVIKVLVANGANVDATRHKECFTALSYACRAGHKDVVKELLASGATPNVRICEKKSTLSWWGSRSEHECESPLHIAVRHGHADILKLLLDCGTDVTTLSQQGVFSALFLACKSNNLPMVKLLIDRGASVNYRTTNGGVTPLMCASCMGSAELVSLLLQHGADPCAVTTDYYYWMLGTKEKDSHSSSARPHAHTTALFWASLKGFHSIARMLLIAGANAYHTRSDGATPLSVAKDEPMKRLIRAYQAGGPSWLVQQLCAREQEWPVVCDIEEKLVKEGFGTKELFLAAPMSQVTHEYLRSIGITQFGTCQIVITVRLEGTWLGARLAALGITTEGLQACEACVMQKMGCHLEVAFANLPESLLTSSQLECQGLSVYYHHAVRQVHTQVCAARDESARLSQVEDTHL